MSFGAIIKTRRLERNLTQGELSKLAGISLTSICEIENEKNSSMLFETAIRISKALKIDLNELANLQKDYIIIDDSENKEIKIGKELFELCKKITSKHVNVKDVDDMVEIFLRNKHRVIHKNIYKKL